MANTTKAAAVSNGAWSGDNPIHFALPLLIIQLCLVLFISRVFVYICRPLRQPRVIAEIIGGLVLGPSAMGYIPHFSANIFPKSSLLVLDTVANIGLIYFLFMVGLELDLRSLKKTGKQAITIAVAGVSLPFIMGIGAAYAMRDILDVNSKFGPFLVFMGVAISITAFPVLARILAERKLLTTDVGQMAMSAAAVNDVAAWVLLALAVALSNETSKPQVVAYILLCGIFFLVVMFTVVRWFMAWLARKVVDNEPIPETFVAITLLGVFVASFCTDVIGIHGIFGAFVFGLIIPKSGPFAQAILEKIEDFVSIILLPLYFASSGLKTRIQDINSGASVGLVFLVIALACSGKIGGTMIAALLNRIPFRKSLVLGILMNTKGLVELIVLNIGLQKKILTSEIFTIMVLMALATTFMTTPLVMLLYEPAREKVPYTKRQVEGGDGDDLRMVVCVHGMNNLPAMLNLTEVLRGSRKRPLRCFMLHLVELSERSSAIMLVTRVRKNGLPFYSKEAERQGRDQVAVAFQQFSRLSKVTVEATTAISQFSNMHEDIDTTANSKRATLIVLPFHKQLDDDGHLSSVAGGFRDVNQRVLRHSPCSVAILVDRGFGGYSQMQSNKVANRIALFFFGGPDDREALSVARRMVEHPGVSLKVVRFIFDDEEGEASGERPSVVEASGALNRMAPSPSMASFHIHMDKVEADEEARYDEAALKLLIQNPGIVRSGAAPEPIDGNESTASFEMPDVIYEERKTNDAASAVLEAAEDLDVDLIIVGQGRRPAPLVAQVVLSGSMARRRGGDESTGLGPVGEILSGRDVEIRASVLVVQQHNASIENLPQNVAIIDETVSSSAQ